MMSPRPITGRPACGRNRGGSHPETLRGPVGKERPAGPRSHLGTHAVIGVARRATPVVPRGRISTQPAGILSRANG